MFDVSIEAMLTIKSENKIFRWSSRPTTTKKVERRFMCEELMLESTDNLIQMRKSHGRHIRTNKDDVHGALKMGDRRRGRRETRLHGRYSQSRGSRGHCGWSQRAGRLIYWTRSQGGSS